MNRIVRIHFSAVAIAASMLCATVTAMAAPTGRAWKTIEQPLYPLGAVQRGIEGQLLVEFRVDDAGMVVEPRVVEAAPAEIFDGSVLTTMTRWRYNVDYDRATSKPATPLQAAFVFQIEPCARLSYLTPEGAVRATDLQEIYICESREAGRPARVPPSQSDALFETAGLKEQMGRPEYVGALRAAESDAAKIQTQRTIPQDGGEALKRRTSLPRPVINPHIRRAGVPVAAVVMFDVDGSGRVKNVAAVPSPGGQELADVLAHAVAGWLFESKIENGVGTGRAGLVAFLSVEFDDPGKSSCGKLKSAIPADFAERVCFRATH